MENTIGERIKARRKELGITVEELAQRIGKNKTTLYRYESGEIEELPITILEPLARALYTTPAELMLGEKQVIPEFSPFQIELIELSKDIKDVATQRRILEYMTLAVELARKYRSESQNDDKNNN